MIRNSDRNISKDFDHQFCFGKTISAYTLINKFLFNKDDFQKVNYNLKKQIKLIFMSNFMMS